MIVYPHVKPGDQLLVDGLTHEQEVKERRTSRGKTFDLGGNQFRLRSGIMPVHFHDGKRWQDVDLTVTERNGIVVCDTAGYEVKFDRIVPSLILEGPQGEAEVVLDKVGGKSKVDAASYRVEGNEIIWDYGDYSIHAEVRPAAVEFYKLLKTPAAPRKFEWLVKNEKRNVKFSRKSAGQDKGKRNLQMVTSSDGNRYIEEWTGKVGIIADKKTRRKSWAAEAGYPVLVDTAVQVGITADADDGTELAYSNTTAADLFYTVGIKIGRYGTVLFHPGFRFQALAIPKNAVITSATITVKANSAIANMEARLYGDLTADAPAFSNADLPTGINKSVFNYQVKSAIALHEVLELPARPMVQSIIDQAGWTTGNDVRFAILVQNASYNGEFIDYPSTNFPLLDVVYTFGSLSMPRVRIGH